MDIVGRRRVFYAISGCTVAASILAIAAFGLRPGVDFTGGSLLEVEFAVGRPPTEEIARRLAPLGLGELRSQPTGARGVILRFRHVDEPTHREILIRLATAGSAGDPGPDSANREREAVVEQRFDTVGPTIGAELRRRALVAIAIVILLILGYIAWAFRRISEPVRSWIYGAATVIALLHDVTIPAGFSALMGRLAGFEANTLFVTALLTILGFSVHDTIVVFDRIRERLTNRVGKSADFPAVVNQSVNETMARSVNTSLTVLLALAAVWIFGGASTRAFSATMIVGVVVGTYSSICLASPLLVTWHQWSAKLKVQSLKQ